MDQVDCFERPDQYLELDDLAFLVPSYHVDAVNADAINLDLELQRCVTRPSKFSNVSERFVEEYVECGGEILKRDRFADLRCMDNRRVENDVVGQK